MIVASLTTHRSYRSSRSLRYLSGVTTHYLAVLVAAVISLWLTPFTLNYLGSTEFAVFNLATGILSWLMLFNFGIAGGLRLRAAQLAPKRNRVRLNDLASTAVLAQLALAAVALFIGVTITVIYPYLLHVQGSIRKNTTVIIVIFVVTAALTVALQPFSALLVAHELVYISNLVKVASFILRAILIVVLLRYGGGVIAVAAVTGLITASTSVVGVLLCYWTIPGLKIHTNLKFCRGLRDLGGVSLWLSVSNLSGTVITSLDQTIVGSMISLPAVTILILTGKTYEIVAAMLAQAAFIAQPAFGQLIGERGTGSLFDAYRRFSLLFTGAAAIAYMSVWSANQTFLASWVGSRWYGGRALDCMLVLSAFINTLLLPQRALLTAALRVKSQALIRIAEALINLLLSISLINRFGIVGVVIATLIASLLTSFWCNYYLTAKFFRVSVPTLLKKTVLPLVLPILILLTIGITMQTLTKGAGYRGSVVAFAVVVIVGISSVWFLCFDQAIRHEIMAVCRDIRRAFFYGQRQSPSER